MLLRAAVSCGGAAPPRVLTSGLELELIASEPEIVTPIGLAFDRESRLLVVESHTHQRPNDYEGPAADRIRMLADSDGDGWLDRWSTFAEGFRHATNVLVRADGAVYVVTRRSVVLLRDIDNDGVADEQDEILRLESEDDYPHNGLSGIAQAADGTLIIGLGENHGMAYRMIGSDGKVIVGGGGEDGFFRCTAEGAQVQRLARGVWNPFGICMLSDGRIFAVDNDPDASPPCRLLHVVPGGDYGYLFQYGRPGTHPLQCWNGELPGTLPMVCGVGEAPTAIVAHRGWLWVTSWGDHRIERYRLVPRGASYGADREIVVQGDADFRPTGMAVAPDGSLYFGDWVLRDYPVHGKGRIWRVTLPNEEERQAFVESTKADVGATDPFAQAAEAWRLSHSDDVELTAKWLSNSESRFTLPLNYRMSLLSALQLQGMDDPEPVLREALQDQSAEVRLYAVRWIADERMTSLRDEVAKLLGGPQPSARYYLAVLAALDWLDHEPKMRGTQIADELLVKELQNESRSPEAHTLALRLLSPNNKFLTLERLHDYVNSTYAPLRLEAVRSLAQQTQPARFELLASIAGNESEDVELRVEAIVGLAAAAEANRDLLENLADGGKSVLKDEARRVLRLAGMRVSPAEVKPAADDLDAWNRLLSLAGDAESGRRLFFSSVGPRCGTCHQHGGRGGRIGPDLTHIGRSNNREQIIASILQPSREVAPHYQPWLLVTSDGKTYVGLRQPKAGDDGMEDYVDSAGIPFSLPSDMIEERSASGKSIMPDGLQMTLSIADLRDVVTFLTTPAD